MLSSNIGNFQWSCADTCRAQHIHKLYRKESKQRAKKVC